MIATPVTSADLARGLACDRPGCPCHRTAETGKGLTHCPGHDDRNPSLKLDPAGDGTPLWYDHGGCSQEAVEAGLIAHSLWLPKSGHNGSALLPSRPTPIEKARYPYTDENGRMLFEVVRFEPKDFRQRRPTENGGWDWNLNGTRRVLYRLPELLANRERAVTVVEGEKDADRLAQIGLIATTSPGGAGKWRPEYGEVLKGRRVIILPDNDEPGREHAEQVAGLLQGLAAQVRVVRLPGLLPKGDVSDWLDAGHSLDELKRLARATRIWMPAPRADAEGVRRIRCRTAADIGEATPETIPWIAEPWIALGTLTELDGAIKASGKTTFSLAMVRAIVNGELFMGQPTLRSPVVYLTEQPDTTYRESLRRAGLLVCRDLHVISWVDTAGYTWEQVCQQALDRCQEVGAKLLVTDTLGQFSGVRGDSENDSGAAMDAVRPLLLVAGAGIGVWIDRHDRKGGGDVGESGRGSSQYGGMVDTILRLHRTEGNTRPTMRQLDSLSRFDETPTSLVIELTRDRGWDEYKALGSGPDVALQIEKEKIFDATPADGSPVTAVELFGKSANGTQDRALKALVEDDRLIREGKGVRGNAYIYRRKKAEGVVADADAAVQPFEQSAKADSPRTPGIHGENELGVSEERPAASGSVSESTDRCLECGQIDWIQRPDGTRLCGHCVTAAGTGRDG